MIKENRTKTALLVIDMENGFVCEGSCHMVKNAANTLPACKKVIEKSRELGVPVFFVKRIYRNDGSDVEITRYQSWLDGGRAMAPESRGVSSAEGVEYLKPQEGDYTIIKPRWSAFFKTELDLILRRLDIKTVAVIGTTTPNCIRTTAYDANSLDYEVVVIEDCCSSQTELIQVVNIEDLFRMGAVIMNSDEFCTSFQGISSTAEKIRADRIQYSIPPEPIKTREGITGWTDIW